MLAVIWGMALFLASRTTLWDRDESRYGTAALEMVASGNWLFPTFNHEPRVFQPIMIYWLMAAGVSVLGGSELAVRLPSTLAFTTACALTALIARRLAGRRAGLYALGVAGTAPLMVLMGTAATTDAVLLACILTAQWVFVEAWHGGWRAWHVPVMGLAIGAGLLTKGPFGLLFPVVGMAAGLILARRRGLAVPSWRPIAAASALGIALFLAWGLPANAATGGAFWRVAIVERLPARLFTAMEGHGGGDLIAYFALLPFYLVVLAVGCLPWTMYVRRAMRGHGAARRLDTGDGVAALPLLVKSMIVPILVLLTLMVSKLPHYALPLVPWVAVAVGALLARLPANAPGEPRERGLRAESLAWNGLFVAGGIIVAVAGPSVEALSPFRELLMTGGLLASLTTLAVLVALAKAGFRGAAAAQMAGMAVLYLFLGVAVLPRAEALAKPGQTLARAAAGRVPEGALLASYRWTEPGMHFYLGGRRIEFPGDEAELEAWAAGPGPRALVLRADDWEAIRTDGAMAGFNVAAEQHGLDHVSGKQAALVLAIKE